ncbi:hypothetical protein GCM10010447_37250 [Streptomyces fulvorobeus]
MVRDAFTGRTSTAVLGPAPSVPASPPFPDAGSSAAPHPTSNDPITMAAAHRRIPLTARDMTCPLFLLTAGDHGSGRGGRPGPALPTEI